MLKDQGVMKKFPDHVTMLKELDKDIEDNKEAESDIKNED